MLSISGALYFLVFPMWGWGLQPLASRLLRLDFSWSNPLHWKAHGLPAAGCVLVVQTTVSTVELEGESGVGLECGNDTSAPPSPVTQIHTGSGESAVVCMATLMTAAWRTCCTLIRAMPLTDEEPDRAGRSCTGCSVEAAGT